MVGRRSSRRSRTGLRGTQRGPVALALVTTLLAAGLVDVGGAVLVAVPALAATVEPAPASVTVAVDRFSASLAARSQGSPVLVSGLESSTSQTYANPDGSFTVEQSAAPVRVKQADGSWAPVDLTLQMGNSVLAPKMSPVPVVLSAGRDLTVASENVAGGTVQVGWNAPLPVPTISGESATYANVVPGTDLVVVVLRTGFEINFVIHQRPAVSVSLPLTLNLKGLTAQSRADGSLSITDGSGNEVGQGGVPVQYGALDLAGTSLPTRHAAVADTLSTPAPAQLAAVPSPAWQIGAGTAGGQGTSATWTLAPDLSFLTDPTVTYPVTVDPSYTFTATGDTYVKSNLSTSQYSATRLYIGTPDAGTTKARTYLAFGVGSALSGMYINTATLRLYNSYSATCAASLAPVYVYSLAAAFSSSTVWSNKPGQGSLQGSANYVHNGPSCSPAGYDTVSVVPLVQDWANNPGHLQQVQVSSTETDTHGWKEFYSTEAGSGVPALIVNYLAYPATPTTPVMSPEVGTGPSSYWTNSITPTLSSSITSATGNSVQARFEIYAGSTLVWSGLGNTVASGGTSKATVASTAGLSAGVLYTVRVWGVSLGAVSHTWSNYIQFHVDTTAPGAPVITSTGFPGGSWVASAPGSNTFTFGSPSGTTDITSYQYLKDTGQWSTITATSGSASITWLPTSGGHTLQVRGVDQAGNVGSTSTFAFGVGPAAMSTTSQTQIVGYAPIGASGPGGANGAYLQYRQAGAISWIRVANSALLYGASPWNGTSGITTAGGVSSTPVLVWDLSATSGVPVAPVDLDLQVCFTYSSGPDSCSTTTTVQRVGHDTNSTTAGPGSVSINTGEFSISASDSNVPGFAGSLGVNRTLLSLDAVAGTAGPFGPGWQATLPTPSAGELDATITDHLTAASGNDGTLALTYPDGSVDTYGDPNWNGTTDPNFGSSPINLTYVGQNANDTSGTKLQLSTTKLTLTVIDPDGTQTVFTRSAVSTAFSASEVIQPQTQVGGSGSTSTVTSGSYSGSGLPTGVVSGDTWVSTTQGAPGVSCSTAGAGCRILTIVTAGPGTAPPTDPTPGPYPGQVREELYTTFDPVAGVMNTSVTAVFGYDHAKQLVSSYDPRADVTSGTHLSTTYAYDSSNRPTSLTPPGQAAWVFGYDTAGRLTWVKRHDPVLSADATNAFVYAVALSGTGLPSMTSSDVATWGQPAANTPVAAFGSFRPDHSVSFNSTTGDWSPGASDWAYANLAYLDSLGRTVNTAAYGAGAWQIDTTVYDTAGRVDSTLTAGNRALALASTCPDASIMAGLVCAQTPVNRAALLSEITVYSASDPSLVTDTFGPTTTVTLADGSTATARAHTNTSYDQSAPAIPSGLGITAWRLATTITTGAYVIDALVDPTALTGGTDSDVQTTINGYNPIETGAGQTGPTSGWVLGQPTTVTPATGITNSTQFDAYGRVVQTRLPMSTGTDQGTRITVYYSAAANGTYPSCGSKPQWDGLVCETFFAGTGISVPITTTTYSMLLAPAIVTDTSGSTVRTTTNNYDAAGRVTSVAMGETNPPTGDTGVATQAFGYDPGTGLATTVTTSAGVSTTGYDTFGRVVSQTDGTGANTATTTFDIDSRPGTVTDAKGTTGYTYDSSSEHRGLLTGLDAGLGGGVPSGFTGLTYDAGGNLTSFTFPNGVVQADTLNTVGALVQRSYTDLAGTLIAAWTRTYRGDGQVAAETGPSAAGSRSQNFNYDAAGRLTNVVDLMNTACTTRAYQFNKNSDRTSLNTYVGPGDGTCPSSTATSTRTGTFNAYDQLTGTTITGAGAGSGSYSYDVLGRSTGVPVIDTPNSSATAIGLQYFYNDLIHTQTQGSNTRTYILDAANRLGSWTDATASTSTAVVNHYDNNGDSPAWTQTTPSGGGGSWTRMVASPAGELGLIATGATGVGTATTAAVQIINPHGDVFTTIPDTTNASASTVTAANDTDEYGNTLAGGGLAYGWIGGKNRITDPTTGLVQMGIRVFNPVTGTFGSTDPIYGGNPNPYIYPTDPINGYDVHGRMGGGLPGFAWCAAHHSRCSASFGPSWVAKHWKVLLAVTAVIVVVVVGVAFTGGLALAMVGELAPEAGLFANVTMFSHFGLITFGLAGGFLGPTWVLLKHLRDGE